MTRGVVGLAPKSSAKGGRPVVGLAPTQKTGGRPVVGLAGQQPKKKHGGGGILGTIAHVITQTPKDLGNAALHSVGGTIDTVNAGVVQPWKDVITSGYVSAKTNKGIDKRIAQTADTAKQTLDHPLRHPGDTLLLLSPALHGLAAAGERAAAAGGAIKAGEGARGAVRAASHAPTSPRVLKVGEMEVRGHYSRAAGSRVAQKATDKALQAVAEKSVRGENLLHRRAAKWNTRNQRVADTVARAPGTMLEAAGRNLKPEELRALRLVAEETPVARRLGAQEMRAARAKGQEVARHRERIDLTKGAMRFLDEGPGGKPTFKPEAVKLAKVYDLLKTASGDREKMLKQLDLMDEASLRAAKTKTARVAAGATVDKKTGEVVGATDITPSAEAIHVGNPVERSRFTGKPRISSTSTFGHTRKPSSLKVATGGAVEHALERNDVTRVVAERHSEAVRLTKIDRLVQSVKPAGEAAPRRKDDVFVWTNKLISNERIPKDVKTYLQNPESLAKLAPDEQQSLFDKVKQSVFQQEDWRDQTKVAEFKQHAKQGKGVFVPRRLLGEAASRDYSIGHLPGVKFVDAVNNAQKAGLVYLKLNYPVVQGLSNVAMNLIQQGFAYPLNITRAVKLFHNDPELTAYAKDVMGQGAVMQAAFEGQGAVSHLTQKLGQKMSSGVDTPARLTAFYHEARLAGYGNKAKFRELLLNPANAGDLAEVTQRATEAIVDYGDLGPFERSVIRRLVFVYPWQKGATKYAGHFLRDHPVQAAALSQLARRDKQNADQTLGPVPSYLEGVHQVGGGLINPAGVNFFQTPAQIGQALGGLVTGNPATPSGADFLSPFPGVAMGLAERRDSLGRPLTGNVAANVRDMTVAQTPVAALARAVVGSGGGKAGNLVRAAAGSRTSSATFPNPADAYWRFLFGGLYPRQYDRGSLNQNAAREKTGR